MARVEVITGPERRRRWSAEQKRAIVAASLAPGAVVTEIARRAEICPGQIYRWRREIGVGNGFAQVLIAPVGDGAGCPATPAIEIEFAGRDESVANPTSSDMAHCVEQSVVELRHMIAMWTNSRKPACKPLLSMPAGNFLSHM
jgi:transposase